MKRLWIDENGIFRAEFEGENAIIGWLLEQDIQSSQVVCQEYLTSLEAVQCGKLKEWAGTGNAFTVFSNGPEVTITCDYSDHELTTSTSRLIGHLRDWLDHIAARDR